MRILVTGGTGFLGKNLVPILKKEHDVIGIGHGEGDLRIPDHCATIIYRYKPDVVIHAAGNVGGIGYNKDNSNSIMHDNLIMGINMLEASSNYKVRKFIMLGTVCAYPKFTKVPFEEQDLWLGYPEETNAPYGIAKRTLMKLGETYCQKHRFNVINLVPTNMYGPFDHFNLTSSHVIPALIVKIKNAKETNNEVVIWGTGQASREFLYVEDCVNAINLAIEKEPGPDPINIGIGKEVKICDLVSTIADLMNFNGRIVYDTSQPDGQPRRCLDVTKAREKLGFEAQTDLKEGLRKTIDWFLEGV